MYVASMDIKTAFDEAKPKHVAKIWDDHNAHGWLIAASALSGMASFERWRAVSTSIDAHGKGAKEKALFGKWKEKENINYVVLCGQLLDHVPLERTHGANAERPY